MTPHQIYTVVSALICAVLVVWALSKTEFLQDITTIPIKKPPFSLARTILMYWTVIVVACYHALMFRMAGGLPDITPTMLTLLGIAFSTSATGRVIDYMQINNPNRSQDNPSEGFLKDICSDDKGLSVHRFQHVLFNVIFGCYTLVMVFSGKDFPPFNELQLALLGISAGTYAIIKIPEN